MEESQSEMYESESDGLIAGLDMFFLWDKNATPSDSDAVIAGSGSYDTQSEKKHDSNSDSDPMNMIAAGGSGSSNNDLQYSKKYESDSDSYSCDSDDSDNIGVLDLQVIQMDEISHFNLDPIAELCVQHFNDTQVEGGASFRLVKLDAVRLSFYADEYYYTFKARSNHDDSLHTFQAKVAKNKTVVECKISDVPYIDRPDKELRTAVYKRFILYK